MEVDLVGILTVYLPFCLRQLAEGFGGFLLHPWGQRTRLDQFSNLSEGPFVLVRVRFRIRVVVFLTQHIELRSLDSILGDLSSGEPIPLNRKEAQFPAKILQVQAQINQSANKHVAANSRKRLNVKN